MVLNDFKDDFGRLCEVNGKTKSKVAMDLGINRQQLHKYQINASMSDGFVRACEALGYDIEIQYVKRR